MGVICCATREGKEKKPECTPCVAVKDSSDIEIISCEQLLNKKDEWIVLDCSLN